MPASVTFPTREAYLLYRLRAVEERMAPLWPQRNVHLAVVWLLAVANIIVSHLGYGRLSLGLAGLSLIAVIAYIRIAMLKIQPLRRHRDWILWELFDLDPKRYDWLMGKRAFREGDRFDYSRRIRELADRTNGRLR